MQLEKWIIEDISYVGDSFPGLTRYAEKEPHYTQVANDSIECKIVFIVRSPSDLARESGSANEHGEIRTVKVPRGLPCFKLRTFIRHCEQVIAETYGKAYRLNVVLIRRPGRVEWTYQHDLPLGGVIFS